MKVSNPRTVTDDRGATHDVTHARRRAIWPRPWDPAYRNTPILFRVSQITWIVVLLAMMAISIATGGMHRWLRGSLSCFVIPALGLFLLFGIEKRFKPWSRAQRLDATRCRACDYTLTSLTPDPDGCTTCPECGAAWKLPPAHPDT
ncbi:MAG: hypothetical protein ACIAQU_00550 [Phycisphaerales bacterium JB064]